MADYCNRDDVKARLAGQVANMPTTFDDDLAKLVTAVSAELDREIARARGITAPWSFIANSTASVRRFTGKPGPIRFLPIDDCVEVASVTENGVALVRGVDWDIHPLNGVPITALVRLHGTWSTTYGAAAASCKWGAAVAAPRDLWNASVVETVRSYLSARAGEDDSIGMTPFGSVVTSKAFTSKTWQLINTYGHGAGFMR